MIHTQTYAVEQWDVADIFPHIRRLMDEHKEEMAHYPELMRSAPNEERYQLLQNAGMLFCHVLRADREVVGYSASLLVEHPHHGGLLMLMNDALFVSKAHRKGRAGLRLMQAVEVCAGTCGAKIVTWNAQPDTPFDKLLQKIRRYRVMNTTYCKEV